MDHFVVSTLRHIFEQMPGCWGCKDLYSTFIYANKEYAKLLGISETKHLDIIGKTDAEMPCKIKNCADLFHSQDKQVIATQQSLRVLNIHPFADNRWKTHIVTKSPFFNQEGRLIGVIFHAIEVSNLLSLEPGSLVVHNQNIMNDRLTYDCDTNHVVNKSGRLALSNREIECLFFILRGGTAKLIAQYLQLSYRTVEEHITAIKIKFNVKNKYELIHIAMQSGFFSVIPQSLFKRQLSIVMSM